MNTNNTDTNNNTLDMPENRQQRAVTNDPLAMTANSSIIDLSQLTALTTIYQKLMSGFHITENDLILWQSLDQHLTSYQALFTGLGYNLIKDARGYFYFSTPDTSVTMTKTSRRIALFLYTLIEYWADQGYDPVAALFEQPISKDTLEKLFNHNTSVFEQIDVNNAADIRNEIIKRMVRLGFAKEFGKEYKLLAPCYRYIDAVMELSDQFSASIDPLDDTNSDDSLLEDTNTDSTTEGNY